jgi:hypothetical protein
MTGWWWIPGRPAAEQEFSRPGYWYRRGNLVVAKTAQGGWLFTFGQPSLGNLICEGVSLCGGPIFDTGSETLGM